MKKYIALLLTVILCVSLCACAAEQKEESEQQNAASDPSNAETGVQDIEWISVNCMTYEDQKIKQAGFELQASFRYSRADYEGFTVSNSLGVELETEPFCFDDEERKFCFWLQLPDDPALEGWHTLTLHFDGASQSVDFYLEYAGDNSEHKDTAESDIESGWVVTEWLACKEQKIVDLEFNQAYAAGDVLDADSLGLVAVYDNGKREKIPSGFTWTHADLTTAGTQTITVEYAGLSVTRDVEVLDFFELSADIANYGGKGYNENEQVYWLLYITARYRGNYLYGSFDHNLSLNGSYSGEWATLWDNAKAGSAAKWEYGCMESGFTNYHSGAAIVLPDDPDFAGQYTASISFGDCTKTVFFTLVYAGDYDTGTGWQITDVSWT